jgi:hypothetical protein
VKSKEQILSAFKKNTHNFTTASSRQRAQMRAAFQMKDGHQWYDSEVSEREHLGKRTTLINVCSPLIRAVSGSEVLQDKKLQYVPMSQEFDKRADLMDKMASYMQVVSGYDSERSLAIEDALTSGIGATITWLDMTKREAISGEPVVQRIFPLFLVYDTASRGSNINRDSRFCGYADPVDSESLTEYIENTLSDEEKPTSAGSDFAPFFLDFARGADLSKIDLLHHHFWWDYEPIYDVANPFQTDQALAQLLAEDDTTANIMGEWYDLAKVDGKSGYWSLTKPEYDDLKKSLSLIQDFYPDLRIPALKYSKRMGKCYYRAEIARGTVLKAEKSFTQDGFPLNFIVGYYDETESCYYGLMRPMEEVQRSLNIAISDLMTYVGRAVEGGDAYIKGSFDSLEAFAKRKRRVGDTPLPSDAEITPKALMNTPDVLVSVVNMLVEILPRTVGLGQEFLGVITTGDMTDSLYGKVVKQSYAVLANFSNHSASYSKRQGEIFISLARLMAEAEPGRLLPLFGAVATDDGSDETFRIDLQNLAEKYAIRIVERPLTTDERQDMFNALTQLIPVLGQAGVPTAPVMAIAAKYSRLDLADRKALEQLATPQAPQPDPVNEGLLISQTNLQNAQAKKYEADAELARVKAQKEAEGETLTPEPPDLTKIREMEHKERLAENQLEKDRLDMEIRLNTLEMQREDMKARRANEAEKQRGELEIKAAKTLVEIRETEADTALKEQTYAMNDEILGATLNRLAADARAVSQEAAARIEMMIDGSQRTLAGTLDKGLERLSKAVAVANVGREQIDTSKLESAIERLVGKIAEKPEPSKPAPKKKRRIKIVENQDGTMTAEED